MHVIRYHLGPKRYPVPTVPNTDIHMSVIGFGVSVSGSDIDTRYQYPLLAKD